MKYLSLLLLSVLFIPLVQVAHAQNIVEQIGQAFNNLTSGMMGGNQTSAMLQAPVQVTKHQAMQQAPVQVTKHQAMQQAPVQVTKH